MKPALKHPSPFAGFARLVMAHRILFLAALALCTAFFAFGLKDLKVNNSNDAFFVENDPNLAIYRDFQKTYGSEDFLLILLSTPQVFSKQAAQDTDNLLQALSKISFQDQSIFTSVISPFHVPFLYDEAGEIGMKPMLQDPQSATTAELLAAKDKILGHEIYRNLLVTNTQDGLALIGLMQPNLDENYARFATEAVNSILKQAPYAAYKPLVVGGPALKYHLDTATESEAAFFGAMGLLVCILLLVFFFQNIAQVATTLGIVLLSVIFTLGLLAWLKIELTLVTILLPLVLLIVGTGNSVHILNAYRHFIKIGHSHAEAMQIGFAKTGRACLFTALTTAVGFGSMMTAPVKPTQTLGAFLAIGVLLALLLSFICIPLFLRKSPKQKAQPALDMSTDLAKGKFFDLATLLALKNPKVTTLVLGGAALILSLGILKMEVENNFTKAFKPRHSQRLAIEAVDSKLGGSHAIELLFDSGKSDGIYNPNYLHALADMEEYLKTEHADVVTSTLSMTTLLREANFVLNKEAGLPKTEEAIAQMLFLFESAGGDTKSLFDAGARSARMSIRSKSLSTKRALALEVALREEAPKIFRKHGLLNSSISLTGIGQLFVHLTHYVIDSQIQAFFLASFLIALLMMWLLGSVKLGLLSMAPNILPVLATYGLMGFMGIPLDWLTAIIPAIALGIAVDGTIHIGTQFKESMLKGQTPHEAAELVILHAGKAIMITSLVLCGGFSVFGLSILNSLSNLGLLMAFCLLLALVLDLLMTPALLAWLCPKELIKTPAHEN